MAGVINEVEGGLLAFPGLLDVLHDQIQLFSEHLGVCIEDDLAVALLEVDAFEASHYVFLVFEHVGQVSEALELFKLTQLLILLVEEESSLQMNRLEKLWLIGHISSYLFSSIN